MPEHARSTLSRWGEKWRKRQRVKGALSPANQSVLPTRYDEKAPGHNLQKANSPKASRLSVAETLRGSSAARIESNNQQPLGQRRNLSSQLWDEAYAKLKEKEPSLVEPFERILSLSLQRQAIDINERTIDLSAAHLNCISLDPDERRTQVIGLVEQRRAEAETRARDYELAYNSLNVSIRLKKQIGNALEAYPPAALAFCGATILLQTLESSMKARAANIDGLQRIIAKQDSYLRLVDLLLRQFPNVSDPTELEGVREDIQRKIINLYKDLLEYQMKTVCAYYHHNRLATFAKDQICWNDWEGDVDEIVKAENELRELVSLYDGHISLDFQSQQTESLARVLDTLQRTLISQTLRDSQERRQKKNELIASFSMAGLNYEDFKDSVNRKPVKGTCNWCKQHTSFKAWQDWGTSLLLISALPGAGKSVLARSIVDDMRDQLTEGEIVCHFFFKDATLQDSAASGICALLHQLLSARPWVALKLQDEIERESGEALRTNLPKLWGLLQSALDYLVSDSVTIIIDALDECAKGLQELARRIVTYILYYKKRSKVRFLITLRPYEHIHQSFSSVSSCSICLETGDKELGDISREIDLVIDARMEELSKRTRNPPSPEVLQKLAEVLKAAENRTYLWLRLVLEVVEKNWQNTEKAWLRPFHSIPKTVYAAYEELLKDVEEEDQQSIRVILAMLLATNFPLSVKALCEAHATFLRLERTESERMDPETFKIWFTNVCGFLVHIYQGNVFFIHQTVREFLADKSPDWTLESPKAVSWKGSLDLVTADRLMSEICVEYLSETASFEKGYDPISPAEMELAIRYISRIGPKPPGLYERLDNALDERCMDHPFFDYATYFCHRHLRVSRPMQHDGWAESGTFWEIRPSLMKRYLDLIRRPNAYHLWELRTDWLTTEILYKGPDWESTTEPRQLKTGLMVCRPQPTLMWLGAHWCHLGLFVYGLEQERGAGKQLSARSRRRALEAAISTQAFDIICWCLRYLDLSNIFGEEETDTSKFQLVEMAKILPKGDHYVNCYFWNLPNGFLKILSGKSRHHAQYIPVLNFLIETGPDPNLLFQIKNDAPQGPEVILWPDTEFSICKTLWARLHAVGLDWDKVARAVPVEAARNWRIKVDFETAADQWMKRSGQDIWSYYRDCRRVIRDADNIAETRRMMAAFMEQREAEAEDCDSQFCNAFGTRRPPAKQRGVIDYDR